jgi:hypothetical protein
MRVEEVEAILMERWAHHIMPDAATGCWLWGGGTTGGRHPYAQAYYDGKTRLVNRIIMRMMGWEAQDVRHKCDVKLCVNPHHLTYGTRSENILDRSVEDRQETYRKAKIGWTKEMLSARNKKVRAAQLAKMTPEERSARAGVAARAQWAGTTPEERRARRQKLIHSQTHEQLSANAKKANEIRWNWVKKGGR